MEPLGLGDMLNAMLIANYNGDQKTCRAIMDGLKGTLNGVVTAQVPPEIAKLVKSVKSN